MYQPLKENDSFCSNPSHGSDYHEDIFLNQMPAKIEKFETTITITADDSLYGLALKYNLNVQNILSLNNLSSDILYPGQKLKLLLTKSQIEEEKKSRNKNKLEIDPNDYVESVMAEENSKGLMSFDEMIALEEYKNENSGVKVYCFYCTSSGEIQGELTFYHSFLNFQPDKNNLDNQMKIRSKSLEKFHALIDFRDIVMCEFLKIKEEIYLQILLNAIGECKNEIYKKKVIEYKSLNKPMASAFFKFQPNEEMPPSLFNDLSVLNTKINNYINEKKKHILLEIAFSVTKIPFYDIIAQKESSFLEVCQTKNEESLLKKSHSEEVKMTEPILPIPAPKKVISKKEIPEEYLPRTKDKSTILNKDQFHDLINALPPILKLCNWHMIYANMTHGTCFEVLFRLVGDYDFPNLLVIKDWKGNVFGAYFNEGWKRRKLFYGAGETFLFTFRTGNELQVYSWTKKNNYFLLTNGEAGICIGAGDYFGLYIYPDLTRGYSFPSETFDNDFLTAEKDFSIARLEIWMVDYEEN